MKIWKKEVGYEIVRPWVRVSDPTLPAFFGPRKVTANNCRYPTNFSGIASTHARLLATPVIVALP